ncbi:MAG: glycoside hydrolase, partial [Deltaproteobacteria bacterium]|nr:glycoside hydrolase [Deltaproteobacteria bacterium]
MTLQVSSWLLEQLTQQRSQPVRRFTLGGCDYSDYVLRWPVLQYRADTIDLGTTQLEISNPRNSFYFFVGCDRALTTSAEISLGFMHPTSGEETLTLYQGVPTHFQFAAGGSRLRLQLQGQTRRLTNAVLGSDIESKGLDFTGSAHLPCDLAWTLITSFGGFSSVKSSSNPDLDYPSWEAWLQSDRLKDVRVHAYLTGEKVYQVVNALAILDSRMITFQKGRILFSGMHQSWGERGQLMSLDQVLDLSWQGDPSQVINQFTVEAGYQPSKGKFLDSVTRADSDSMAAYGIHSGRYGSRGVWFVNGTDGYYLAEDQVRFYRQPQLVVTAGLPLGEGLVQEVGTVVWLVHSGFSPQGENFRITAQEIDLNSGRVNLRFEKARHRYWEPQTQVASINLRLRWLTDAGSGAQATFEEFIDTGPVYRAESGGVFVPTNHYGSAMLSLGGGAMVLAGVPSSWGTTAVMRRSSNGLQTVTAIQSLNTGIHKVHALYQTSQGVILAGVHSGGVYRSTDQGSSWSLTAVISGTFHLAAFIALTSDSLLGFTGNRVGAGGMHVWESVNGGIGWGYKTTLVPSGNIHAGAVHRLSGSEFLLAHMGAGTTDRGVIRLTQTASRTLVWATVFTWGGFHTVLKSTSGALLT